MYDENPAHPMMQPYRAKFILDRREDLLKIKTNSINLMETERMFHDWKSYCEPYGFGFLGLLSSRALVELSVGRISDQLIQEIEQYLEHHARKSGE